MPIFLVSMAKLRLKRKKVNNRFKRYLILNAEDNKAKEASIGLLDPTIAPIEFYMTVKLNQIFLNTENLQEIGGSF